jgi:hypothetical protein
MPTLDLQLPHRCAMDGARACCEKTFDELRERYKAYVGRSSVVWNGDVADFTLLLVAPARIEIAGKITVSPEAVTMKSEFEVPLMLRGFPIGAMIADGIRKAWAEKCKTCPEAGGGAA